MPLHGNTEGGVGVKKHRCIIGQMKQPQETLRKYSPEWTALHAKKALNYLAPLIRAKNIAPNEALVLAAMQMDYNIVGRARSVPEHEVFMICEMIMIAWKRGLFAPGPDYPYTLKQMLDAVGSEDE